LGVDDIDFARKRGERGEVEGYGADHALRSWVGCVSDSGGLSRTLPGWWYLWEG
jgi:hypothetical protein